MSPSRLDVPILRSSASLVQPGQTLAIVGASGCDKRTIVCLLERFHSPTKGQTMVDDVDKRCTNVQNFRAELAVVEQEPVLFNTTIRENIPYALPDDRLTSDKELHAAAKVANIHEFILNLPEKYSTVVGEKVVQLSGGERQRVSIVRAVIRNPRILLLDDATSALDSNFEKNVQTVLNAASSGRACIVMAHGLSTVKNADIIAVMDRGEIIEQGSHDELLAKNGHSTS